MSSPPSESNSSASKQGIPSQFVTEGNFYEWCTKANINILQIDQEETLPFFSSDAIANILKPAYNIYHLANALLPSLLPRSSFYQALETWIDLFPKPSQTESRTLDIAHIDHVADCLQSAWLDDRSLKYKVQPDAHYEIIKQHENLIRAVWPELPEDRKSFSDGRGELPVVFQRQSRLYLPYHHPMAVMPSTIITSGMAVYVTANGGKLASFSNVRVLANASTTCGSLELFPWVVEYEKTTLKQGLYQLYMDISAIAIRNYHLKIERPQYGMLITASTIYVCCGIAVKRNAEIVCYLKQYPGFHSPFGNNISNLLEFYAVLENHHKWWMKEVFEPFSKMLESSEEYAKIVQHLESHNESWRMIDHLQGLESPRPTSKSDIIENGSYGTHSTDDTHVTDDNEKCTKLNLDALGKLSTEESISHYLDQLHHFEVGRYSRLVGRQRTL